MAIRAPDGANKIKTRMRDDLVIFCAHVPTIPSSFVRMVLLVLLVMQANLKFFSWKMLFFANRRGQIWPAMKQSKRRTKPQGTYSCFSEQIEDRISEQACHVDDHAFVDINVYADVSVRVADCPAVSLDLCIYTAGGGNPLYQGELLKQCSSVKKNGHYTAHRAVVRSVSSY